MASTHLLLRSQRRRRPIALPTLVIPRHLPIRAALRQLGHERTVAVAVAAIVLGASFLSVSPGRAGGDTGGPTGDGPAPRLGIGGPVGDDGSGYGRVVSSYAEEPSDEDAAAAAAAAADAVEIPVRLEHVRDAAAAVQAVTNPSTVAGPFLDDGTLLKPVAVDTSVPDGSALIRTYKVKNGDTLAGIAAKFDVTTMTLWWANKLKAKNALVRGQELRIPPVTGLVVEVKSTDTLASLARRYKIAETEILATNQIEDPNLVVGQVLVLPDAKGAPIKTPKPKAPKATSRPAARSGGSSGPVSTPRTYSGGNFAWPAPGGRISQYFHYGHYAIDIDGDTGDRIVAAASGTVTFAGWKSNGGGYQVWISHGSGLYTTYNHMSSVSVGRGQHVSKGQRVGRMGATGFASGSHLHFEVWRGPIWSGGTRVNPLGYL
ncbi:MAG TPA: M23 family metallopeptidase [Candidatus Binatia bacterium]|nr:M23 family metallopeptidase [Candidatus Binatia bacterium]